MTLLPNQALAEALRSEIENLRQSQPEVAQELLTDANQTLKLLIADLEIFCNFLEQLDEDEA